MARKVDVYKRLDDDCIELYKKQMDYTDYLALNRMSDGEYIEFDDEEQEEKLWVRLGGYVQFTSEEVKKIIELGNDNSNVQTIILHAIQEGRFEISGDSYIPDTSEQYSCLVDNETGKGIDLSNYCFNG